jgi:cation transport protein ChaC
MWVFAYGSLMWRPGFEYAESAPAWLAGAHRALCVYSWVHRGTREKPGLVLGLDQGGSCRGVAYRVTESRRDATLEYLRARELVTDVYREAWRPVRLGDPDAKPVNALCYLVDRSHPQYAGNLPRERLLELVRESTGVSGANRDYVIATAAQMRALGFRDDTLAWLAAELGGVLPERPR